MSGDEMPRHWYDDYESGRPDYPDGVADVADLPRSSWVADLAAGSGKLTRLLSSRFARVTAVEPDPLMRHLLSDALPHVTTLDGTAETIPLADSSMDAIFVAQAFHWFDTEEALTEMARVLRPGGTLVVTWNVSTGPCVPGIEEAEELLAPFWPTEFGFPFDMMDGEWAPESWSSPVAKSAYEQVNRLTLPNPQPVEPDALVAFFGSMGWVGNLPDEERRTLLQGLRRRLVHPRYVLPWETRVHWTRRRDHRENTQQT